MVQREGQFEGCIQPREMSVVQREGQFEGSIQPKEMRKFPSQIKRQAKERLASLVRISSVLLLSVQIMPLPRPSPLAQLRLARTPIRSSLLAFWPLWD